MRIFIKKEEKEKVLRDEVGAERSSDSSEKKRSQSMLSALGHPACALYARVLITTLAALILKTQARRRRIWCRTQGASQVKKRSLGKSCRH